MAQTHVLAKHLENHGHLTGPEHGHLIASLPVDAFEALWEPKGWVAVDRAGEPVESLTDADPARDEADTALDADSRARARADRARKFTRTAKSSKTEKAEG